MPQTILHMIRDERMFRSAASTFIFRALDATSNG
jgi:hypothetical protein